MRRTLASLALALTACTGAAAPRPIDGLLGKPGVVTLTNLHPDAKRSRLTVVNYQQRGLIPVCSRVTLLDLNSGHAQTHSAARNSTFHVAERLRFREEATGQTYEYFTRSDTGETFQAHLARYFGDECPAALQSLSEIDRQGVAAGKALVGMSKHGVIFAMGYPPLEATPSLDGNRWVYWRSRFNRGAVVFDGAGHVMHVDD